MFLSCQKTKPCLKVHASGGINVLCFVMAVSMPARHVKCIILLNLGISSSLLSWKMYIGIQLCTLRWAEFRTVWSTYYDSEIFPTGVWCKYAWNYTIMNCFEDWTELTAISHKNLLLVTHKSFELCRMWEQSFTWCCSRSWSQNWLLKYQM